MLFNMITNFRTETHQEPFVKHFQVCCLIGRHSEPVWQADRGPQCLNNLSIRNVVFNLVISVIKHRGKKKEGLTDLILNCMLFLSGVCVGCSPIKVFHSTGNVLQHVLGLDVSPLGENGIHHSGKAAELLR